MREMVWVKMEVEVVRRWMNLLLMEQDSLQSSLSFWYMELGLKLESKLEQK